MLEHLGLAEVLEHHGARPDLRDGVSDPLARDVRGLERVVEEGKTLTRDLGGKAGTAEVGATIAAAL